MKKTHVPLCDLHCRSCELRLEYALKALPGIQHVTVSHVHGHAVVTSDGEIDMEAVTVAVESEGYRVGTDERRVWLSRDGNQYAEILLAIFMAAGLYIVAKILKLDALAMQTPGGSGAGAINALLVGLAAGVSTCMALVGGLILGVSARYAERHPEAHLHHKFLPHLSFNGGRIIGFFLLGGLLGMIGGFFQPSPIALGILTIIAGMVMLFLGLQLTGLFPALSRYQFALPASIARHLGLGEASTRTYTHRGAAVLGLLTFFLPCGFTQTMQLAAVASGSFLSGGFIMAFFALGTAPGLLSVGALSSFIRERSRMLLNVIAVIVTVLALGAILNGTRLTGIVLPWEQVDASGQTNIVIEDGVQIARMNQTAGGYEPSHFVVKRGIPVRWIVNATNLNTCTSSIAIPSLHVTKVLTIGENTIEFTPEQVGTIRFTCSMGMYPGTFTVIE
jgi:sulfite exporter TauE/SafE/copper chaperone CopZ